MRTTYKNKKQNKKVAQKMKTLLKIKYLFFYYFIEQNRKKKKKKTKSKQH